MVSLKAEIARIASGGIAQAMNDQGLNLAAHAGVNRVDLAAAPQAAPTVAPAPAGMA
jgi:hypothetical protein